MSRSLEWASSFAPNRAERRGTAWVVGAFLLCPCHLPLTLWAGSVLLAGSAAGSLLRAHPYLAGALITTAWMAATARGLYLLQMARKCETCGTFPDGRG